MTYTEGSYFCRDFSVKMFLFFKISAYTILFFPGFQCSYVLIFCAISIHANVHILDYAYFVCA